MKKLLVTMLVMVMVLGLMGGVVMANDCERYGQGYWKQWLAENDDYACPDNPELTADVLLGMLNTPARGNPTQILLYQFIAASLNVNENGCELPEGTGCDGNDVEAAFLAASEHLEAYSEGEDSASRQDILVWKDILEVWNQGYDPGFYLWERHDDADPYSGLDADKSYAEFTDNGDGTGVLTIYLFDMYGCPVTENAATGAALPNNTFRANSDSKANDHFYYIGGAHFNEPAYPGFSSSNRVQVEPGVYQLELSSVCAYDQMWEIGIGSWLQRSQVKVIDTVNINIECPNLGVVNADNSGAEWLDNEDGTATMTVTVKDCCDNGIEGLGMDDISITPTTSGTEASLTMLHGYSNWGVELFEQGDGVYTVELNFSGGLPYNSEWDIKADGELIEELLAVGIS